MESSSREVLMLKASSALWRQRSIFSSISLMLEKVFFDYSFLRVVFLKLVFDFFLRRLGSGAWMQLESVVFPLVEVSCLGSSISFSKSSSNSDSVLALIASNSFFVVEVRKSDFFELIDEFVEFRLFCSF